MMASVSRVANVLIAAAILAVVAIDGRVVWMPLFKSECPFWLSLQSTRGSRNLERRWETIAPQFRLTKREGRLDLWQWPQGSIWAVHGDSTVPLLIAEDDVDVYEPSAEHSVHPGDIVLDCGANIGIFTKRALARGAKLVVAIEPAPDTLIPLRRNLSKEIADGRVIVYPKGVWNKNSELELSLRYATNPAGNSLVLVDPDAPKVRVPLTTIDQIVSELQLERVDFIKMDIEGSEKPALEGGRDTIRRFHPRMTLSSEHLPDDYTAIPALVKSIEPGYSFDGCDCSEENGRLKALALAFHPPPRR